MYLLLINLLITFTLFFSLSCGSDEIMVKGAAELLPPANAVLRGSPGDSEPTAIVKFDLPASLISSATIDIKQNNVSVNTLTFNSLSGFSGEVLLNIGQTYSAEASATCSSNSEQATQTQTFTVSETSNVVTFNFVCGEDYNYNTSKNISFNAQVTDYTPSISDINLSYDQCNHEIDIAHTVNPNYTSDNLTFTYNTSIKVYLPLSSNPNIFSPIASFMDNFTSSSNIISGSLRDEDNDVLKNPNNSIKVIVTILLEPSTTNVSNSRIIYEQILTRRSSACIVPRTL